VRDRFRELLGLLLEPGAYAGIATHDKALVESSVAEIRRRGLPPDRYEFQMLLGVTERLRKRLVADGHRLRVYVPYGEQWLRYCLRRMRENPNMVGHILKNLFTRD
jgi:proline dehydrogenase